MNEKPVMKSKTAVVFKNSSDGVIRFYADPEAIKDFSEFGSILDGFNGAHFLYVNGRYDFDEVVNYIENWGKEAA